LTGVSIKSDNLASQVSKGIQKAKPNHLFIDPFLGSSLDAPRKRRRQMKKGLLLFVLFSAFALFVQLAGQKGPEPAPVGTWESIGPEGIYVMSMAPNPISPAEIWVVGYSLQQPQVFRTQDGGLTWTFLSNLVLDPFAWNRGVLTVAPTNPAVLYAPQFDYVNKSTDAGLTWSSFSYGNAGYSYGSSLKTAVSPADPDLVYIGGRCKDSYGKDRMGVLKSTDGGLTWSGKPVMAALAGDYALSLALDPTQPGTIFLGGSDQRGNLGRLFRSSDGGDSWTDIVGSIQDIVYVLAVDPINPLRGFRKNIAY
jgi:hypothetical protein